MRSLGPPRPAPAAALAALAALCLAGCPGGDAGIGEPCDDGDECAAGLQCAVGRCVPRCRRAPDCGDGYACTAGGRCVRATGTAGDACASEAECAPGLSCQLDGVVVEGRVGASCTPEQAGHAAGAACAGDGDCRNGTCALGRCLDLCRTDVDCPAATACVDVPRVEARGAMFDACVPDRGALVWELPVAAPSAELLLAVPSSANGAALTLAVDDATQRVGATEVISPSGETLYRLAATPDEFFASRLRHQPGFGQAVLAMPSSPATPLEPGAYHVSVTSLRANDTPGSQTPRAIAALRIGDGAALALHFHFLDLTEHPCDAPGAAPLAAATARAAGAFQGEYVAALRGVLAGAGVVLGATTYEDVVDHPELDGLDVAAAPALLALGAHRDGVNVFFVRTLAPAGLLAYGPNPGPAGVGGSRGSGVIVSLDGRCYRSWAELARVTAHELARYMGLYRNVEPDWAQHPAWQDPIADSDQSRDNLMYFSDRGGAAVSDGQRAVLSHSPVLQ